MCLLYGKRPTVIGHVIYYNDTVRATVVRRSDSAEAFLTYKRKSETRRWHIWDWLTSGIPLQRDELGTYQRHDITRRGQATVDMLGRAYKTSGCAQRTINRPRSTGIDCNNTRHYTFGERRQDTFGNE